MVNFKAEQMNPLYPNMDGQILTRYLKEVEEIMMNKQLFLEKKTNMLPEKEDNITKKSKFIFTEL